jgi:hypothetical protein
MSSIIKPLANTVDIGTTANNIDGATVVKVVNHTGYATLVFNYANGSQYADIPVANNESVIVQKGSTDLIIGTGMSAAAIAWPKG